MHIYIKKIKTENLQSYYCNIDIPKIFAFDVKYIW